MPHLDQCGSLLRTIGLPTMIKRALALVTATLNLWTERVGMRSICDPRSCL